MLAVQLPADIERRLEALAKATGRSKDSYVQEAVVEYLADLEDSYLARRRLDDIRAGRARALTLAEVERDLGWWRIEFAVDAAKELTALATGVSAQWLL